MNTILVDFRALDTLGEAVVLAVVALGLVRLAAGRPVEPARTEPAGEDLVLGLAYRVLAPVMLTASAVLFLRGHEETGGGFIGALLAGTAVGLGQLAHPGGRRVLGRLRSWRPGC